MRGARQIKRGGRTYSGLAEAALHGVLLIGVLAIVFPGVILRGEIITGADLLFKLPPWKPVAPPGWEAPQNPIVADVVSAFHPFYVQARAALDRGEWPLWNPAVCAGVPLMANCQSAVFYPPRLLHAFLDIPVATSICIFLKLWLCGMTAFLCGRGIGLGRGAARFLSLAWMLTSYNQFWAMWPLPDVSAWLPVLFLGVESAFAGATRRAVAAIAAGGSLILLAGHPETAFAMSFDLGVYVLIRAALERRWGMPLVRLLGVCLAGWCVALLVATVQWLPFVEYLLNSYTFHERHDDSFWTYLLPNTSVCLFVPRFYGVEADNNFWGDLDGNRYGIYPGIAVWIGAALLLARRRELGTNGRRLLALALAVASAFFFTFNAPGFQWLHQLPGFMSLRQSYHVGFGLWGLAVLAAWGTSYWLAQPARLRQLAWSLVVLVPASAMVYAAWNFYDGVIRMEGVGAYVQGKIFVTAVVAFATIVLLALRATRLRPAWILLLLTALLSGDLLAAGWRLNPTLPRAYAYPDRPVFAYLRSQGTPVRIEPGRGIGGAPGVATAFGVQEWMGYDGIYPLRILRFAHTLRDRIWNAMEPVCATRFYLSHELFKRGTIPEPEFDFDNPDIFALRETIGGTQIYENIRALPRAFLAGSVREIPGEDALFEVMADKNYDPLKEVVTDRAPRGNLPEASSADLGSVEVTDYGYTSVRLRAQANTDCVLVLADAFFPGWHAYIDGDRAEVFPAYYAFRGVLIPAGDHNIEFRYEPWTFRVGLWVSVATLVGSLLVCLALGYRNNFLAPF